MISLSLAQPSSYSDRLSRRQTPHPLISSSLEPLLLRTMSEKYEKNNVPVEISQWTRTEDWRHRPSVLELIRRHYDYYRHDLFAQVIYGYVYGKDRMAQAIKEVVPRKDYEFLLARLVPSNEIVGWIALSFSTEGDDDVDRVKYEARLEWTEMCSHILKSWKVDDDAGKKSNVWDTMRRVSSDLQARHLPRNHCIINTIAMYPQYQWSVVPKRLLAHAIDFWKQKVKVGTEWAMWVQAPLAGRHMYKKFRFQVVGRYDVELGDYGFPPKEDRKISGKYPWIFMVLRGESGSATPVPVGPREVEMGKIVEEESEDAEEIVMPLKLKKGKIVVEQSEDVEEIVMPRKKEKGKGKERPLHDLRSDEARRPASVNLSDDDAQRMQDWVEAEERLEQIRTRQGLPPLPGEVASLTRIQRRAEERGPDITGLSKGKGVERGPDMAGLSKGKGVEWRPDMAGLSKGKGVEWRPDMTGLSKEKGAEWGSDTTGLSKGKGVERGPDTIDVSKGKKGRGVERGPDMTDVSKGKKGKGIERERDTTDVSKGKKGKGIERERDTTSLSKGKKGRGVEQGPDTTDLSKGKKEEGVDREPDTTDISKGKKEKGVKQKSSTTGLSKGKKEKGVEQESDKTGLSKGKKEKSVKRESNTTRLIKKRKSVERRVEDSGPAQSQEPITHPLPQDTKTTNQPKDDFTITESEKNLLEAIRRNGIDEEHVELLKVLTLSLSDEATGR